MAQWLRVAWRTSKKVINITAASALAFSGLALAGPLFTASAAASPTVVINEISSGASSNDWVELYNPADTSTSLTGWTVSDSANNLGTLSASSIAGHGYVTAAFGNSLNNSGDSVTLKDASAVIVDSVTYGAGGQPAPASGQSLARVTNGGDSWALSNSPTDGTSNDPLAEQSVCASGCDVTTIAAALSTIGAGGNIFINDGTYSLSYTLSIDKAVTLTGADEAGVIINASNIASGYGVYTNVDNVTIENLSIIGPTNSSGYGLKIEGSVLNGLAADSNITVTNVAVSGSYHTGVDLNGINHAVLTNVSSTGAARGNGLAITDSHNIDLDGITTSSNAWGGIALYAKGLYYACGIDNISLTGSNSLSEPNALYTGIDNTSNPDCTITNLNISPTDLPYKVSLTNDDPQDVYTTSLDNAGLVAAFPANPVVSSTDDSTNLWVAPGQTIQNVVDNAEAGDTVNVPAGTYSENLTINKALSLSGGQAGVNAVGRVGASESVIDGSGGSGIAVSINASDVSIDGFTVTGAGNTGIFIDSSDGNVTVSNNIISGNSIGLYGNCANNCMVQHNQFSDDNLPGPAGGAGIYTDSGSHGLTIDGNDFTGLQLNSAIIFAATSANTNSNATVTNNTIENNNSNNSMIYVVGLNGGTFSGNTISQAGTTALKFAGADTNISVSGNHLTNSSTGLKIADDGYGFGNSSNINVSGNDLSGDTLGIANLSGYSGVLSGDSNWWGNALGPNSGQYSGVSLANWCTDITCRTTQTASSGNTALPSGPISTPIVSGGTSSITIPSTNNVVASTPIPSGTVQITIPAGTTVTADSSTWSGTITPPTVLSNSSVNIPAASGTTTTVSTVIEVGAGNTGLTFTKAVRLLIPGQAGKLVGFVRNGDFTQITNACSADSQAAGDNLLAGSDCYISVGSDMVVWTKHFTEFVTYSQNAVPSNQSSTGSSSATPVQTASATTNNSTGETNNSSAEPQVLGANNSGQPRTSSASTQKPAPKAATAIANSKAGRIFGLMWYWWIPIILAAAIIIWIYQRGLATTSGKS